MLNIHFDFFYNNVAHVIYVQKIFKPLHWYQTYPSIKSQGEKKQPVWDCPRQVRPNGA